MGDDWKPGDIALCVNNSDWGGINPRGNRLRVGRPYEVLFVTAAQEWVDGSIGVGLFIVGPQNSGFGDWFEGRFRKVTPDAPTADDREVIALLTGKPETVQP